MRILNILTSLTPIVLILALAPACDLDGKQIGQLDDDTGGDGDGDGTGGAPNNPSGDCVGPDPGQSCSYSHAAEDYLPHCEGPLSREFWRVYTDGEVAYMLPRPDQMGIHNGVCDGEDLELADLFESNGLCSPSSNQATVELLNSMSIQDAMDINYELHSRLVFSLDPEYSYGIFPHPRPAELVEMCTTYAEDLVEYGSACAAITDNCTGATIGLVDPFGDGVGLVVDLLNAMYGIEQP